uniref:Cytochrome P450 1A n=1 Tax=Zonotrichia albicollis TaxID=44394 RepID=A0A8D2N9X8_ZONAL
MKGCRTHCCETVTEIINNKHLSLKVNHHLKCLQSQPRQRQKKEAKNQQKGTLAGICTHIQEHVSPYLVKGAVMILHNFLHEGVEAPVDVLEGLQGAVGQVAERGDEVGGVATPSHLPKLLPQVWKARRRLAQSALKSFSIAPSPTSSCSCLLEEHVSKEAEYLVTKFLQVMEEHKRFEPYRYVVVSVANVICAMCFGKRYEHEDQELLGLVNSTEKFTAVTAAGNPADFIPLLRYLPSRSMKLFIDFNRYLLSFLQKRVKEHYESYDENNIRDITDSLIEQCLDKKLGTNTATQIPKEKIVNLVNDLFGAGILHLSSALAARGGHNCPHKTTPLGHTLQEQPASPLRTQKNLLSIFSLPSTTKDTVLNGYFIPKDRCVFVNQWQVNHDEKLWKDPETFNPERFLSADGTKVNKEDGEKVLAFGLGKRRCIGENIARWQVFLFLTTLLQQLEFSVCEGGTVDMTPLYGLSLKHKRCEHFQARQRFPTKGRS